MNVPARISSESRTRARAPALIEAFGIRGLHGYRTISLKSKHAATILIAKNGTGKTTLLGVLDAFLRCQYSRLAELQFESIFCKFRDHPEQLILTRSDLELVLAPPDAGELVAVSNRVGISNAALYKFVTEEWESLDAAGDLHENPSYVALAKHYGYSRANIRRVIGDLLTTAYDRHPNVAHTLKVTREVLKDYEVLYLPTYRRVELTLRARENEPSFRRKKPRFDIAPGSFFTGNIQFGLGDIADRLSEMNEQIAFQSNSEYRKISAAIINELIDGSFERSDVEPSTIPSREDLQLLFSRVEQSRSYGPYDQVSIPNLDKLYDDDGIHESSRPFLIYFLNQLDRVIEKTRGVEARVQDFVSICNRYLSSDDDEDLTIIENRTKHRVPDGKRLVLNRTNLQVRVVSVPDDRRISLDALSSGEKQMISLFAKLFLYEKPKIVLIDEPELSLSIDWQRQILVDVVSSPLCDQMIAITHSPFVFDNVLEPYAGSIQLEIAQENPTLFGDDRFGFEDDAFDE